MRAHKQTHTHKLQGKVIICKGGDMKKKNNIWRMRWADGSPPPGAIVHLEFCVLMMSEETHAHAKHSRREDLSWWIRPKKMEETIKLDTFRSWQSVWTAQWISAHMFKYDSYI